jgi:polysaccharide pyruvyl transferase WcaK-like protein
MTLQLVNEYTSDNLGDAVIYETLAQLGGTRAVHSHLSQAQRRHVRGLAPGLAPADSACSYVSVGGDIFNNARPALVTRRFLHNVQQLAACPPQQSFLFGQTIPSSCRGLALRWLARTLRRLSGVTVRDALSHARLRALGVQAELCWDVAFGYECSTRVQAAGQALLAQAGLDAGTCALMSVREFDAMYPHNSQRMMDRLLDLAQRLRRRGFQPVVLLQASATGADSDLAMAQALQQRLPELIILSPFAVGEQHHPVDALVGVLGLAEVVVAVRYHSAVLRLLGGRIPFSLHYATKGADLAQRLQLPGMALESFDPAAAIAALEASALRHFDPRPLREAVRSRFAEQLAHASTAV